MTQAKVVYWSEITDQQVKTWSEVELIHNTYHELTQSATIAFTQARELNHKSYTMPDERLKPPLLELEQRLEKLLSASHWFMFWYFAQQDRNLKLAPMIKIEPIIAGWSASKLISQVQQELLTSLSPLVELTNNLRIGCYGALNKEHEDLLDRICRELKRPEKVLSYINLWLTTERYNSESSKNYAV